jgi:hypothetical protein
MSERARCKFCLAPIAPLRPATARTLQPMTASTPIGTAVLYVNDDGSILATRTRTMAWTVARGVDGIVYIVSLEGRTGGVLMSRCHIDDRGV